MLFAALISTAGCAGVARTAAYAGADAAVDAMLAEVNPEIDSAVHAAADRLRFMTSAIARKLTNAARRGFDTSLGKLETQLDSAANQLAAAAFEQIDGVIETALDRGASLWSKMIDEESDLVRAGLRRTADAHIEAEMAMLELALDAERALARSFARADAAREAKAHLDQSLAAAKTAREACAVEHPTDPSCEERYRHAVRAASDALAATVDAAVDEDAIEAKLRDSRMQAEKDTRARARTWLDAELAALETRVGEARVAGRTHVGKITDELRASLKASNNRLARDLRDHLRVPNAERLALMSEDDITRLVAGVLDGFLERLSTKIKSELASQLKHAAHAAVDSAIG